MREVHVELLAEVGGEPGEEAEVAPVVGEVGEHHHPNHAAGQKATPGDLETGRGVGDDRTFRRVLPDFAEYCRSYR